ncbi:GNAT family N-acetyltransferase [Aquipuribacter hungaricus]|uniref:GNAT family N-acetyltransferase n=1 Tax=Aquipuribacter hungaricus TaxID=545624 RepID=A0ABV7WIA1_9MICO
MPPAGVRTRRATAADAEALAGLAHGWYGGDAGRWRTTMATALEQGERVVVAECDGETVGYAKAGERLPTGPDDPAPAGTWLTGAVVAEQHRRAGVAGALVGLLLAELRPAGRPVWSMADAGNRASLALHARAGFTEVLRAPSMLGEDFRSGEGVLLRLDPS